MSATTTTTSSAPATTTVGARLRKLLGSPSVPVLIGLIVIWTVFQIANDRFLSSENLSNLAMQIAPVAVIALGIVLVLLLGEIDLSAGSVSGLCGAVTVVASERHNVPWVLAAAIGIAVGAAIGVFHGSSFTLLKMPSFVVTLAGLIAWQGAQLHLLGSEGTVNLPFDEPLAKISGTFLASWLTWVLIVAAVVLAGAVTTAETRRRSGRGLPVVGAQQRLIRLAVLGGVLAAVAIVLGADRGVPLPLMIVIVLTVVVDAVLMRTAAGRHVYAVGGSEEAARRAGISVHRVRISVFAAGGALAAAGGILAASRLAAVNQSSGGSDTLLNAIAAAVIGGTSLFGGKGRAYSALLGALVIVSISNGMLLLSLNSSVRFMITGAVLFLAVAVDALTNRSGSR
jgi:D-xylose transport system permease protein